MQDARRARQARRFLDQAGLSLTSFRAEDGEHLRLHMTDRATRGLTTLKAKPPIGALGKNQTVS